MTEKRFEFKNDYHKGLILVDNLTNEIIEEDIGTGSCYSACNLLNKYDEDCKMYREDALKAEKNKEVLLEENKRLKQELQKIQNSFELNWTQNRVEYDKDKLYIKDINTEVCLDGTNLSIRVRLPSLNEYYQFKYKVTGRSLMREFIEEYNSKGDDE